MRKSPTPRKNIPAKGGAKTAKPATARAKSRASALAKKTEKSAAKKTSTKKAPAKKAPAKKAMAALKKAAAQGNSSMARAMTAAPRRASSAPARQTPRADHHPLSIGSAEMTADGTLCMRLRSETTHGIAELVKTVKPGAPDYATMVAHLGGIKPGEFCSIPAFP